MVICLRMIMKQESFELKNQNIYLQEASQDLSQFAIFVQFNYFNHKKEEAPSSLFFHKFINLKDENNPKIQAELSINAFKLSLLLSRFLLLLQQLIISLFGKIGIYMLKVQQSNHYQKLQNIFCSSTTLFQKVYMKVESDQQLYRSFLEKEAIRSAFALPDSDLRRMFEYCEAAIHYEFEKNKNKTKALSIGKDCNQTFASAFDSLQKGEKVLYYNKNMIYLCRLMNGNLKQPNVRSDILEETIYTMSYTLKMWKKKSMRLDSKKQVLLGQKGHIVKQYNLDNYIFRSCKKSKYFTFILEAIDSSVYEKQRSVYLGFQTQEQMNVWANAIQLCIDYRHWRRIYMEVLKKQPVQKVDPPQSQQISPKKEKNEEKQNNLVQSWREAQNSEASRETQQQKHLSKIQLHYLDSILNEKIQQILQRNTQKLNEKISQLELQLEKAKEEKEQLCSIKDNMDNFSKGVKKLMTDQKQKFVCELSKLEKEIYAIKKQVMQAYEQIFSITNKKMLLQAENLQLKKDKLQLIQENDQLKKRVQILKRECIQKGRSIQEQPLLIEGQLKNKHILQGEEIRQQSEIWFTNNLKDMPKSY